MRCNPGRWGRPGLAGLGVVLLVGLLGSGPGEAGTAFFTDGRGLTVEDAWVEEGRIFFRLPGGGIIGTSQERIVRVLLTPAEPPEPEPAPEAEAPPAPVADLGVLVRTVSRRYGVDEALVAAVVRAESGFDPRAVSRVGAMGLMQLMPGTAADMEVADPFDPEQNLEGGVRYLKWMMERFPGRLDLALAAYNAGPAAVDRYGGVPPFPETRSYVRRVMAFASR